MDRSELAERNRKIADYQHQLTWREEVRRNILRISALFPAPRLQRPNPGTFLIIRPDHIGDNLLTMPSLLALKQARPQAKLIGLVGPWSAPIMASYRQVDQVLTLPFPGFTRGRKEPIWQPYVRAINWARRVRTLHAEVAVIMRPDHWWGALLAHLAGIPIRVGYDVPEVEPFLTHPVPFARGHVVRQCLRLLENWTGVIPDEQVQYTFPHETEDVTFVQNTLAHHTISSETPLIVIHPGAGTPIKRWASDQWATVADRLTVQLQGRVLFTGSDTEFPQIEEIRSRMKEPSVTLAGETSLGQLAALYARALVVIGSDSGPLHLAVASGAPTVHLYGPADPDEFGPWGDRRRQAVVTSGMGCAPCRILAWPGDEAENHPCIRDITPRQVIEATLRAIGR